MWTSLRRYAESFPLVCTTSSSSVHWTNRKLLWWWEAVSTPLQIYLIPATVFSMASVESTSPFRDQKFPTTKVCSWMKLPGLLWASHNGYYLGFFPFCQCLYLLSSCIPGNTNYLNPYNVLQVLKANATKSRK